MRGETGVTVDEGYEAKVRAAIEALRWPDGPVCPNCGSVDDAGDITAFPGRRTCRVCRTQFRVTTGTPLDNTHFPLTLWVQAVKLLADEPDITVRPLATALDVSPRSAWLIKDRAEALLRTKLGKAIRDMRMPRRVRSSG